MDGRGKECISQDKVNEQMLNYIEGEDEEIDDYDKDEEGEYDFD